MRLRLLLVLSGAIALSAETGAAPTASPADALSIEQLVNANYAYLDRLPQARFQLTPKLRAEAMAVQTPRQLVRFAERALLLLADHHAITGSSLSDSWAVVPSYSDLWIERRGAQFFIEQVREGSLASRAGIRAGDRLLSIDRVPAADAVSRFWADLGTSGGPERDGFAARILAAGRRDRVRKLGVQARSGAVRLLDLPNLYGPSLERPLLSTESIGRTPAIRINDALGEQDTVRQFDAALQQLGSSSKLIIDLTNTPSGGNTSVARGIMGWFVRKHRPYQVHNLPSEERETGIGRQWIEEVLPRSGKHHAGRVTVRVGRWTGSMGEGMAIGMAALGACVEGTRMAGLLGAVYDLKLGNSDLTIKLPAERLSAVDGTPREQFRPKPAGSC